MSQGWQHLGTPLPETGAAGIQRHKGYDQPPPLQERRGRNGTHYAYRHHIQGEFSLLQRTIRMENHEKFMKEALREAGYAAAEDEVPIGAVIVWNGRIIGKGHNMTERLADPTAHAEMIAITAATEAVGGKYLNDCTI